MDNENTMISVDNGGDEIYENLESTLVDINSNQTENVPKKKKGGFFKNLLLIIFIFAFLALAIVESIFFYTPKLVADAVSYVVNQCEDFAKTIKDGKEDGLNDQGTESEIINQIFPTDEIEVLSTKVTIVNDEAIGEKQVGIWRVDAKATFVVNLENAVTTVKNNKLTVRVKAPKISEGGLALEQGATILSEFQFSKIGVSSADVFKASTNSINEVLEDASKRIDNYDYLVKMAEQSAEISIKRLAYASNSNYKDVKVIFESEGK